MAPPKGYEVVTQALSIEATKWNDEAAHMRTAEHTVDGIYLTAAAFYAGFDLVAPLALTPIYDEIQSTVARYCREASVEFDQTAAALGRARDLYERSDARAEKQNTIEVYGS